MKPLFSVVIPVYKNAESIPRLTQTLTELSAALGHKMEVVLVVDGHADNSYALLREFAASAGFPVKVLAHARNFGSFAAIRTGLEAAIGQFFAVMAADLQEPPELVIEFLTALEQDECDVAIGQRIGRTDASLSSWAANTFWWLYRKLINPDIPPGGVDIFGCNRHFCKELLQLTESNSSLVALVFWLGFRRKIVPYQRLERQEGASAWSFSRKLSYMNDSIFAFTNFPIRLFTLMGSVGLLAAVGISLFVLIAHSLGSIEVPGYAPIMLTVLGLGSINLLGLGVIGNYAWRTYENSKGRPLAVLATTYSNSHYE